VADRVRIAIFGPISVEIGDRSLGPRDFGDVKPKQLFEILLIGRGSAVPKDRVGDLLWGDDPPRNISGSIETYVSVLRKSLGFAGDAGRNLVRTEREAYSIDISLASLDIDDLNSHLERAEHAVGWTKRHHLEAALEIGAAELLADEPYADWAIRVRDHYGHRLRDAGLAAADAALETGDWLSGHRHADKIIHADPWNETAYRQLMVALVGMGRRPDAVLAFRRLRDALREDVGLGDC
jgi:DNA-binding SARP family transcriptional activator